jgi:hypothetical protein
MSQKARDVPKEINSYRKARHHGLVLLEVTYEESMGYMGGVKGILSQV